MVRLGLCCLFVAQPIRFRLTTATYMRKFSRSEQLSRLAALCLSNAGALLQAIEYCGSQGIGCFRVNSQFWPVKTHPDVGYAFSDLPGAGEIGAVLSRCRQRAMALGVRLSFHPDQFVLLSSPKADVVRRSIEELEYQAEASEMIGADVINIHAGGGYGDKPSALQRMGHVVRTLNKAVRSRLTLENDDRIYTPSDLLPFCQEHKLPLVYDVHHHRCLPDGLSVQQVTDAAVKTWGRVRPLFHISSPKHGWQGDQRRWHHDYIDEQDFPAVWRSLDITVEVEAKAKELAVRRLYNSLGVFCGVI